MELSKMKLNRIPGLEFLFLALLLFSHSFANSVVAGGMVPEYRNLSVTPSISNIADWTLGRVEIATLEIDNNMPNYQIVLDFSHKDKGNDLISEVQLQGLDGTLGQGLSLDGETILRPESESGKFIWNPGPQKTATLQLQIRVFVIYKQAPTSTPTLTVSMPSAY
jgi:hypothetical protein